MPIRHVVDRHRLDNGLELAVLPDPHSNAAAINLAFKVGSVDEEVGRTGFAHLFEHLMFEGSAHVAPGEHMSALEALGGSVNAYTSSDRTVYHETVPPGALELALWFEADRMRTLDISQMNLDAQRGVVLQEKQQRYDNRPYGDLLLSLVGQHFAPEHPYGHLPIGSMDDLAAATLGEVTAFHRRWYRPSNAVLVIAGAVTTRDAITLVERHFSDIIDAPVPQRGYLPDDPAYGHEVRLTKPVPQPVLHVSWRAPGATDPDYLPLQLGLKILGEGQASRLHRRLIQELGIASETHGFLLGHSRSRSIASIECRPTDGVTTNDLAEALTAELEAFEGPTERELRRIRATTERDWLEELATVEDRAAAAAELWLTHGDPERINTYLDELASTTGDDIARVLSERATVQELHYLPEETK